MSTKWFNEDVRKINTKEDFVSLWFNAASSNVPTQEQEDETTGSSEQVGDISDSFPSMSTQNPDNVGAGMINNLNYGQPTIAEGGRDWMRYPDGGLPQINNPDSSEFDPDAEGSRTSTGEVRRSRADWEQHNSDRDQRTLNYRNTGSSGDMLARGVSFGTSSRAGLGGGWGGQSITLNPFKASNSPLSPLMAGGSGYKKKFPWLLVGGVLVAAGYYFIKVKK